MAEASPALVPRFEREPPSFRQFLFLVIAAWIGLFSQLGQVPLFDLDEGAFSEATREMLADGNFLLPTLNGEPRYDKPVMIHWLQMGSVNLFGFDEFALRLPSALCATLWMLAVFGFARRYFADAGAATMAAAGVALTLMAGVIGHAATADAALNLFLALAILGGFRWLDEPSRRELLLIYLWMGLGALTKGPVAIALPLLILGAFALWQGRGRQLLRAVFAPLGWLVFIAVVAPWVVLSWKQDGGAFLRHFLLDHNLGRYESTMQGHGGKPWYYLAWLPLIVAPLTVALVPAVRQALRAGDALDRFLLLWFGVVFVLFSFSATQLPHYLLYGCTPLFLLAGRHVERLPPRWLSVLPAALVCALFLSLPWLLPMLPVPEERAYEHGIVQLAASACDSWDYKLITGTCLALTLLCALWPDIPRASALLGAALAQAIAVWYAVVPAYAAAQQAPVREAAARAEQLGGTVVSYRTYLPSFSVYRKAVTESRLPKPGELVFVRLDRVEELQAELPDLPLNMEFRKGGVGLFRLPSEAAHPAPGQPTEPAARPDPTTVTP